MKVTAESPLGVEADVVTVEVVGCPGLAVIIGTAATATDGAKLTQQPDSGATMQRWTLTQGV